VTTFLRTSVTEKSYNCRHMPINGLQQQALSSSFKTSMGFFAKLRHQKNYEKILFV